jgi:hypothetical protein
VESRTELYNKSSSFRSLSNFRSRKKTEENIGCVVVVVVDTFIVVDFGSLGFVRLAVRVCIGVVAVGQSLFSQLDALVEIYALQNIVVGFVIVSAGENGRSFKSTAAPSWFLPTSARIHSRLQHWRWGSVLFCPQTGLWSSRFSTVSHRFVRVHRLANSRSGYSMYEIHLRGRPTGDRLRSSIRA